jgi:hypothetical protein
MTTETMIIETTIETSTTAIEIDLGRVVARVAGINIEVEFSDRS